MERSKVGTKLRNPKCLAITRPSYSPKQWMNKITSLTLYAPIINSLALGDIQPSIDELNTICTYNPFTAAGGIYNLSLANLTLYAPIIHSRPAGGIYNLLLGSPW